MTGEAPRSRPTIADVAAAAGVSRTTVSHALNGLGKVNPQTRQHVREVAERIGYRPSARAKALRGGRSHVLGVVSSMSAAVAGGPARLGFFMEVAAAAAERALTHGYALVLVPPLRPGADGTGDASEALYGIAMDGLLVVEPAAGDPVVALARAQRLPFVCVGQPAESRPDDDWVDLHAQDVARLLVRHFADRGVRHPVLMIGDRERVSYDAAVAEFERQAAESGWEPLVVRLPETDGEEGARVAVRDLLGEHPHTDGIVAFVDAFASGVVTGLREAGRRVPQDVRVVTRYDGVRAKTSTPPITAVDLGLADASSRAVDLLVARLGDDVEPEPGAPAGPRLVERASSVG